MLIGKVTGCAARAAIAALVLAVWYAPSALAQATSGNLTDLVDSGLFAYNGLEIAAAKTNDAAFANLLTICQTPATGAPGAGCTGNTLLLFDRLRELEDTANEILGRGETTFSLKLGLQAVGFALRWTAPEEFAAQGSLTTTFANSPIDHAQWALQRAAFCHANDSLGAGRRRRL